MKASLVASCLCLSFFLSGLSAAPKSARSMKQSSVATPFNLRSVFFVTPNLGYAVGERGTIIKTSDAGASWSPQNGSTTQILTSVYFVDEKIGYAVGTHAVGLHPNRTGAVILKTINGGATWTHQSSGVNGDLRAVFFLNEVRGYAVGSGGLALATTDGGEIWTRMQVENRSSLNSLFFTADGEGFAVGSGGALLRLAPDDSVWVHLESPTRATLKAVYMSNNGLGYAVGAHGTILRSVDGGGTWSVQPSLTDADLNGLHFFNDTVGYIVGVRGQVLRKSAEDWVPLRGVPQSSLSSVRFSPSGEAHVAGNHGALLRIAPGGLVLATPMLPSFGLWGAQGIWYTLPVSVDVHLQFFDVRGRKMLSRFYKNQEAGRHTLTWAELGMRPGAYLLRFQAGDLTKSQKIFISL